MDNFLCVSISVSVRIPDRCVLGVAEKLASALEMHRRARFYRPRTVFGARRAGLTATNPDLLLLEGENVLLHAGRQCDIVRLLFQCVFAK